MALESKVIELGTGLSQHVLEWNTPDGNDNHTIVLIHGFLDSSWSFESLGHTLSSEFHVIAPDLRGHGDSGRVSGGGYYHFVDYLADLRDLIAALGQTRLSLVGHSLGGVIAGFYAGTFPDSIEKLVLVEGMGPEESNIPLPDRCVNWMQSWDSVNKLPNRSYASVDDAAKRLQKTDPMLADSVALNLASKLTRPVGDRVQFKHDPLHMTRAPYPFVIDTAKDFWSRITAPTLLVDGEKSRFRKSNDQLAHRESFIKPRRKEVIADAGHWIQLHQPEALAKVVLGHLR